MEVLAAISEQLAFLITLLNLRLYDKRSSSKALGILTKNQILAPESALEIEACL